MLQFLVLLWSSTKTLCNNQFHFWHQGDSIPLLRRSHSREQMSLGTPGLNKASLTKLWMADPCVSDLHAWFECNQLFLRSPYKINTVVFSHNHRCCAIRSTETLVSQQPLEYTAASNQQSLTGMLFSDGVDEMYVCVCVCVCVCSELPVNARFVFGCRSEWTASGVCLQAISLSSCLYCDSLQCAALCMYASTHTACMRDRECSIKSSINQLTNKLVYIILHWISGPSGHKDGKIWL